MAEISADGYQSLKDFFVSAIATPPDWDYIALYDDTTSEVLRASISGDSRASWTDLDGDSVVTVTITIEGADADVPQPTTFEYSALYDDTEANGGRRLTAIEQFSPVTIDSDSDDLTVEHTIEVPGQ